MTHRRLTALAAAASAVAILVPAAPAGAGPTANKSGEELVSYLTTGKLKVKNPFSYQFLCGAPAGASCVSEVRAEIVIPGPNLSVSSGGVIPAGVIGVHEIDTNKVVRKVIRDNIKKAKLRTTVIGTNSLTGEVDTDQQTFKFKK
jgi:hypothetical protein